MYIYRKIVISLLVYLSSSIALQGLQAQDVESRILRDSLTMIGKYDGDKVLLRWYHTNASGWAMGKHYGYQIDRMVMPDSLDQTLDSLYTIEKQLLPYDLDKFATAYKKEENKYLAIAAEIIHGKKDAFVDKEASPFKKAELFENLYHMAMLNAEFDREAALAMALRYEDATIIPGKTYAYRLMCLDTFAEIAIDTVYAIVNTDSPEEIITPSIEKLYWGDKLVKVEWNKELLSNYFTAYFVERSDNGGKTYKQIHTDPYVYSNTVDATYDYVYYDSIPENGKEYFYRIRGINSFAELSPPSAPKSVIGREKKAPAAPYDITTTYLGGTQLEIKWSVDNEDRDIAGFMVSKSPNQQDAFTNLTPQGLGPKSRSFIDENFNKFENNYYHIGVYDDFGNTNISLPVYGEYIDSIPPAPVQNLRASIDTNGIMILEWDASPEDDIKGYFVHFTNQDDHVYGALNGIPISETKYVDTLNVRQVLTEEIYYKVVAVDHTMNYATFSEPLMVKKPDLIPPVAAVFTDYKVGEQGVNLVWANSSSKDLETQQLHRRKAKANEWKLIKEYNKISGLYTTYQDKELEEGMSYEYMVKSIDDDGNTTDCVDPLSVKFGGKKLLAKTVIKQANYNPKKNIIEISWQDTADDIDHIVIFRKKNGSGYSPIKTISSKQTMYEDIKVSPGNEYQYSIKTKNSSNGKSSGLSKPVAVVTKKG